MYRRLVAGFGTVLALSAGVSRPQNLPGGAVCSIDGKPLAWVEQGKVEGFVFPLSERWTDTATNPGPLQQGDPTVVTWGVVPDGTRIPSAFGEPSGDSDLESFLNGHFGSEAIWFPLIESAFDRWEELTGIDFVHEPNDDGEAMSIGFPGILGVRPDVRIGGKFIDGNGGSIAWGLFPQIGEISLDTADDFYDDLATDDFPLRQVMMHEIGHTLGIFHVCPQNNTKIMEPSYIDSFEGPQLDDMAAAHRGYGDGLEPNDDISSSFDLGPLSTGAPLVERYLSIDDGDDLDFYDFSLASTETVRIAAVPLGQSYQSGEEDNGGGCPNGSYPNYNGVQVHNLSLELLDDTGATVATSNAGVIGDMEEIETSLSAGDYTVSVSGSLTKDEMQLYGLWLSVDGYRAAAPSPGDAGELNSIVVEGATPNTTQFLVFSTGSSGVDLAEVPVCGAVSDLLVPGPIVSTQSDGSGNATLSLTAPGGALGKTAYFQVIEAASCTATNPVTRTFQ